MPQMFREDVKSILGKIGLKNSEGQVYLCLLKTEKPLHVFEILKLTNIKRSSLNLILERLINKGYVTYHIEDARKVYSAEAPQKIAFNLESLTEDFKSLIPLLTVSEFGGERSKVRFFEGEDTINQIHRDILLASSFQDEPKEFLAISSGDDIYRADKNAVEDFIKRRVKQNLNLKWLAPEGEFTKRRFIPVANEELREVRFFDAKKYPFHIQINIYADCVALISLKGKNGVIIENELISNSFKSLFNLIWDSIQ
jgi:sugar-specific transcriptional regulator TrmB